MVAVKFRINIFCLLAVILMISHCKSRGESSSQVESSKPPFNSDYLITATMELIKPIDISAMNTSWQRAELVSETSKTATVKVTLNPIYDFKSELTSNPNWRQDNQNDPELQRYLRPGVTTNWDEPMRAELIGMLKVDGIDPDRLTDLDLVQKVSTWLFENNANPRFQYNKLFIPYYVTFKGSDISVMPEVRRAFNDEKVSAKKSTDQETIASGILGKTMFRERHTGDCTASATIQATLLKALGIPTRIVVNVPLFDANSPNQSQMAENQLKNTDAKSILLENAYLNQNQWVNHNFNEVYVGKKWIRLNYNKLAQSVVDIQFLGIMVQTNRFSDWSEAHLESWGVHAMGGPRPAGFSMNPYRAISITDSVSSSYMKTQSGAIWKPVKSIQITNLVAKGNSLIPEFVKTSIDGSQILAILVPDPLILSDYRYLKLLLQFIDQNVVFKSSGHPDVHGKFNGHNFTGPPNFAAATIQLTNPQDLVSGAVYTLVPAEAKDGYLVQIDSSIKFAAP